MPEPAIYVLFAALLTGLTVFGIARAASGTRIPRSWVVAAIVLWVVALVFMTVRPGNGLGVRLNLVPFVVDGPGSAFDAVLNTFVFVPFGILLGAINWRFLPVLGLALGISLTIEIAQFVTDWGRTADVNDLITNSAGASIGWLLAWAVGRTRLIR